MCTFHNCELREGEVRDDSEFSPVCNSNHNGQVSIHKCSNELYHRIRNRPEDYHFANSLHDSDCHDTDHSERSQHSSRSWYCEYFSSRCRESQTNCSSDGDKLQKGNALIQELLRTSLVHTRICHVPRPRLSSRSARYLNWTQISYTRLPATGAPSATIFNDRVYK